MNKRIGKIIDILVVVVAFWFILSWGEVVLKNFNGPADHSPMNIFQVFLQEEPIPPLEPDFEQQEPLTSIWAELVSKSGNTIRFRATNGTELAATVFDPSLFDENGFYSLYLNEKREVVKIFKEVW